MRLDHYLTQNQLAPTRSQAQLLIREGQVSVNGKKVSKTGYAVEESDRVKVSDHAEFVGRGAQKMLAALAAFEVDPKDKVVADVGASTGGFTQVLLRRGAKKVYAIDVGHDQLAEALKKNPRVVNLERINIRYGADLPEKVDLVVADLSFISLRLVVEPMRQLAKPEADFIFLFKPQFEVGKKHVGKNGVVRNERVRKKALDRFLDECREQEGEVRGVVESPVVGRAGNVEYLLWLKSLLFGTAS